jgi:hypothetical protein
MIQPLKLIHSSTAADLPPLCKQVVVIDGHPALGGRDAPVYISEQRELPRVALMLRTEDELVARVDAVMCSTMEMESSSPAIRGSDDGRRALGRLTFSRAEEMIVEDNVLDWWWRFRKGWHPFLRSCD